MPLTREERKLLHQKSKQPTFGVNKPDAREGHEGDIAYRRVEGSGTVQYVKENGDWTAIASSGKMPKSRNIITAPSSSRTAIIDHGDLAGLGNDNHTQYLLISGDRAMTGNLDMGSQSIVSVVNVTASGTVQAEQLTSTDDAQIGDDLIVYGDITVDGEAKLDKTTIDTTDGKFTASGANNIELTTTGSNDINLTSGQTLDVGVGNNYELDVTRTCTWNTQTTNWSNSNTFTLTSLGNITIETDGTDGDSSGNDDASNTILIKNANSNNADFIGVHIKTDSQGASNAHNDILIECDNVAAKGSTFGVDIRSENNIRIRSENNNSGQQTSLLMRATGPIDLGVGDAAGVPQHTTDNRVKIHGTNGIDFAVLYRDSGDAAINTTDAKWDKIDTLNLVRAVTKIIKNTTVLFTDATCDTTSEDATVTFTSTGNANAGLISDGMKVTGTGIPTDSFVTSKTTSSFELRDASNNPVNATANGTNVTLSFFNYTNTLYNNDFILIATILNNDDDDAIGTMWKISITYQAGGNDYAQVWYCSKQSGKLAIMIYLLD
jgi:hypothetical protein